MQDKYREDHKEDPWDSPKNPKVIACGQCGFEGHEKGATNCEVCGFFLGEKQKVNNLRIVKSTIHNSTSRKSKKSSRKSRKTTNKIWRSLIKLKKEARNRILVFSPSLSPEFKKPSNLIGIAVIGLGISLWGNYLLTNPKAEQVKIEQKETLSAPAPAPTSSLRGLFNYGGAPFYAPLVSNGLISTLESDNPGLEYRFAKPLNQDFSNSNGAKMLIEQSISVSFNGRPLTDREYKRAKLRGFQLKQLPIALDGVIFYGNMDVPVSSLNEKQITDIFTGKITNWNQISPKAKDLPIIPIVLENEDLESFGIETSQIPSTAQFVPNHTQAVRRTIKTPGSISFSSASLAQGQKLIQSFEVAEGDSRAYIPGLIDGNANLEAFRDESYPYTRHVFLGYRADESLDEEAAKVMEDFLNSKKGQEIIKKSGFVPLRSL